MFHWLRWLVCSLLPWALAGGVLCPLCPQASAVEEEGVREVWGELFLILREPVVSRTVLENTHRVEHAERLSAMQAEQEAERQADMEADDAEAGLETGGEAVGDGGNGRPTSANANRTPSLPTPADCGLELFSVSGSPAPVLNWVDQNRLRIRFAPGSSPETEYRIVFRPGVTYLSGQALEKAAFSFHCKPAELDAEFLPSHAGGAALISAVRSTTREAQEIVKKHEGLVVTFRRMREIPLVGWVCTGTVPARLQAATLADGPGGHGQALEALLKRHKPAAIREEMQLPQCLLAIPEEPLVPGARYELEIYAAPGSGFKGQTCDLGFLPQALTASLERKLEPLSSQPGSAWGTRLHLTFDMPVCEEQLQALWARLGVAVNGVAAERQQDGSYRAEVNGKPVVLRLRGLIPCRRQCNVWHHGRSYEYAPAGCAMGLAMEVQNDTPMEISLSLPPDVSTPHGLALDRAQTLSATASPACPAMTGNGSNLVAWSGEHRLRLPCINVGGASATLYHWDADSAARLLPVIEQGMRDDTSYCELYQQLFRMRRRAAEGLSTKEMGDGEDARSTAGRALHLLRRQLDKTLPLRARALAAAKACATQELELVSEKGSNELVTRGEALVDLDQLSGGKLRPGLYLLSVTYHPSDAVAQVLASYGMKEEEFLMPCTVDYLVQVTDIFPRKAEEQLMLSSLATGQPLEGAKLSFYTLPAQEKEPKDEEELLAAAGAEAVPAEGMKALSLPQGAAVLPKDAENKLLLLRRGEDYALLSLLHEYIGTWSGAEPRNPRAELFCDRPLYRPGEVVHLRGVLRRPVMGGVALPRAQYGELTFSKPNGEVIGRHSVTFDAYGAFCHDLTLPNGEEDVTGAYRCLLEVEEIGRKVNAEQVIRCEVFRRDAFEGKLTVEMEPVAARHYRVVLQATDFNGTPLAGGKAKVMFSSLVRPVDEAGQEPEGLKKQSFDNSGTCRYNWERELVLDAEGRASLEGGLDAYERVTGLDVSATLSNDREEYVRLDLVSKWLRPADFLIEVHKNHLFLNDARKDDDQHALEREQVVNISVRARETRQHKLPAGISYTESEERELGALKVTVPANCREGVDLRPLLQEFCKEKEQRSFNLIITGEDAEGRRICKESYYYPSDGRVHQGLLAEGRSVRLYLNAPAKQAGKVHAYIGSQDGLRHTLAEVEADARSVLIPLQEHEYGDIHATVMTSCKDAWGTYTDCQTAEGSCILPRPDKELKVEFSLPANAKPGQQVSISGVVRDAEGAPAKASLTLFAVDAGMMSVCPYSLPQLATDFYRNGARSLRFNHHAHKLSPCRPGVMPLPDVWSLNGSSWSQGKPGAANRSIWPAGLATGSLNMDPGRIFRLDMGTVVRATRSNFLWGHLLGDTPPWLLEAEGEIAHNIKAEHATDLQAYDAGLATGSLRSGAGAVLPCVTVSEDEDGVAEGPARAYALAEQMEQPRIRSNFEPVALWLGSVETREDGSFAADCTLPDTLTTYEVYAVALSASGDCFGQAEGNFLVNQELMLTAGTPFFMSTGDNMQLPLTVTNNGEQAGEWEVSLSGCGNASTQRVKLEAKSTSTLMFEVAAHEEGTCTLRWTAQSADGADAVEGSFPVRYPAPLLKEAHHLVMAEGSSATQVAHLLAPELASSARGSVEVQYSTSPLIHLAGSMDFLLSYPYGCTEQRSSALLPWLFYDHLSPFCPLMAQTGREEMKSIVSKNIAQLLARQQEDGGLSYWAVPRGTPAESCAWASAYAGLVLTIAKEQGFEVNAEAFERLQTYLSRQEWHKDDHLTQYASARTRGKSAEVNRILVRALRRELKDTDECGFRRGTADLEFIASLRSNPAGRHDALLSWLRGKGHDYRHRSSWGGGWTLIALSEYLRLEPKAATQGSMRINGDTLRAESRPGSVCFSPSGGKNLAAVAPEIAAVDGTVYVSVRVKAQPEQTEYPGVTEKGLQVTRLYEVKGEDGLWKPAREFKVGDVVRVTLTCAKIADKLEYFVLEDYLPACFEAINPNVPGQAAGLEDGGWGSWSTWFDHKEYLGDRVRGFCTRWWGRDVVNMCYYARVKRAGECAAPPAEAQLMYEPQTYGLSPNCRVRVGAEPEESEEARR